MKVEDRVFGNRNSGDGRFRAGGRQMRKVTEAKDPETSYAVVKSQLPVDSKSVSGFLLSLAPKCEFFHDQYRKGYCRVKSLEDGTPTVMTMEIRGKSFKTLLNHEYWRSYRDAAPSNLLQSAINVCDAHAIFSGRRFELHNRIAWYENAICYDLGDGRVILVEKDGWRIVSSDTIRPLFWPNPHQLRQLEPAHNGDLSLFLNHLNLRRNKDGSLSDDQALTLITFVTCLVPNIAHPIICLAGPQGSAKTTFMKFARMFVDPNVAPILTLADSPRELAQQLQHNYCSCYDNLQDLKPSTSNMLCVAVTGGAFSKRQLFTDKDDVVFDISSRCIILNGINVIPQKPDLLDRSIIIMLQGIGRRERVGEKEILTRFEADMARIFGGALTALSEAMKIKSSIILSQLPRMADYAQWGCAVAEVLGIGKDRFLDAYNRNIRRQIEEALDSSLVAQAVIAFMRQRESWRGTATELLAELNRLAPSLLIDTRIRDWPKASHILTHRLTDDMIPLTEAKIVFERLREGKEGVRLISLTRSADNTSVPSVASA